MKRRTCERCGERWRQNGMPTCRRCAREAGDVRTTRTVQRDSAQRATTRAPQRVRHRVIAPFVPYLKCTRGEWFLVVWDGSVR